MPWLIPQKVDSSVMDSDALSWMDLESCICLGCAGSVLHHAGQSAGYCWFNQECHSPFVETLSVPEQEIGGHGKKIDKPDTNVS